MKVVLSATLVSAALCLKLGAANPIITNMFTADPAAMVYKDTVYLYTGQDEAKDGEMFTMQDWQCFSSTDLKTWMPHGAIMSATDFKWATRDAWASQCIERNGKFYFYAAVRSGNPHPGMAIGVAVSDSPTGPFEDARGSALVTDDMTPSPNGWDDIDPTVFIDDDGTAWLCWGNPNCYLAKLKPNMTEFDGPIQKIHVPNYTEGPWLYKRNGLYYLVYAAFAHQGMSEKICYATATNVAGPWTYRGILTDQAKYSYTIHPAVIEFHGQSYFLYHNATLTLNGEKGALGRRCVCLEYMYYNPDGTIQPVKQTVEGVDVAPKENPGTVTDESNPVVDTNVPDAGVVVTENVGADPTNWPGNPIFSTVANPYYQANESISFNRGQGTTNLSQTFKVTTDFQLQRIEIFAGDGFGTITGNPVTVALYDLGAQDAATNFYSSAVNLFGSGDGLRIAYTPQASGLLSLDFNGENSVQLKAGHLYAFELHGLRKSGPLFWHRTKKDTYADGAAFCDRSRLIERGAECDFAMAVYGSASTTGARPEHHDSGKSRRVRIASTKFRQH